MRQVLEDAVIIYRQEAGNLLTMVAPAIVLGPIAALIAASSLAAALATFPVFLLLYLMTYAVCVRAGGSVLNNLSPDLETAYLAVLGAAPDLLRSAAPGLVLGAGVGGSALVIVHQDEPLVALGVVAWGAVAFVLWAARRAYDQPLILGYGMRASDASEAGRQLARVGFLWTLLLLSTAALPLVVAGLLSWGLAAAITPAFGAAVFTLALALWLPLPALAATTACARLLGEAS